MRRGVHGCDVVMSRVSRPQDECDLERRVGWCTEEGYTQTKTHTHTWKCRNVKTKGLGENSLPVTVHSIRIGLRFSILLLKKTPVWKENPVTVVFFSYHTFYAYMYTSFELLYPGKEASVFCKLHACLASCSLHSQLQLHMSCVQIRPMFRSHRNYRVGLAFASFSIVFEHWC